MSLFNFRIFDTKPAPEVASDTPARVTGPSEFKFLPATSLDRVYQLRVLQIPEDLPRHLRIATDVHSALVHREEEDRILVLETKLGEVAVLWTNRREDSQIFADVCARIRNHKLRMTQAFEATSELLEMFRKRVRGAAPVALAPVAPGDSTRLFYDLLRAATQLKASDMHLQVNRQHANILFRVDGEMRRHCFIDQSQAEALSRTIFSLADNDSKKPTFNQREYQDASISTSVEIDGVDIPLKLRYGSGTTSPDGWDITLRINATGVSDDERTLEQLGYDALQVVDINRMLNRPSGAMILCGVVNAGKSTTIQTLLGMLYDLHGGRKLTRSLENPPEYPLRGTRQHPQLESTTFAGALKSILRMDPDHILIGEIRDKETAEITAQAIQTGIKVLATLHAGDPFKAISRLAGLGVSRSDMADDDFFAGIIYQKLIPLVCPECAISIDELRDLLASDVLRRINLVSGQHLTTLRFRGPGCEHCAGRSIKGRTIAAEFMMPDREINKFILQNNTLFAKAYWRSGALTSVCKSAGRTALDQAVLKMQRGLLSPLDVERAFGYLDDQESVASAKEWYEKNIAAQVPTYMRGREAHREGAWQP